jgi:plasmid stabilization system protein ParE
MESPPTLLSAIQTRRESGRQWSGATIFYRPTATTLEVLRVLHHSQNAAAILKDL